MFNTLKGKIVYNFAVMNLRATQVSKEYVYIAQ